MPPSQKIAEAEAAGRESAVRHGPGPLLVLGAAGTGKTELLARRLAQLVAAGVAPERVLVIGSTRATARRLRERSEALLAGPFEELWISSWETIGERLLREYSEAAGLDPFFDVLGPAERLAMLLDRLDQLPLRRHEIRGNPAGLLARLLSRIDALKADRVGPTSLAESARAARRPRPPTRPTARRSAANSSSPSSTPHTTASSPRPAASTTATSSSPSTASSPSDPTSRKQIAERFEYLMVDELEESTRPN